MMRQFVITSAFLSATFIWPAPVSGDVKTERRSALMPVMYVALGTTQTLDLAATRAALKSGAREANPIASPLAQNTAGWVALKAASTAGTIVFVERLRKRNEFAAIAVMAALNAALAAAAVRNIHNSRALARSRNR